MNFFSILLTSALFFASSSLALPQRPSWWPGGSGHPIPGHRPWTNNGPKCLSDADAQAAADIFQQLINNYTEALALEALTENFTDYSSAVNILRNGGAGEPFTVNAPTFEGRAAFMQAQSAQPPIPFDTLLVVHGCDTVTQRWQTTDSASGQKTQANNIPAVGIALMQTVPDSENSYGFRISALYSEFNAAAWLVNLGVFTPEPETAPGKRGIRHVGMI